MTPRRIELHIERLVIEGLPIAAGETGILGAALRSELSRLLLADRASALTQSLAVPMLAAPDMQIGPGAGAAQIGGLLAGAVHQSLGVETGRGWR